MGQQPNIELDISDLLRPTSHPAPPRRWSPSRPGDLAGPEEVPVGGAYGSTGPDSGYAHRLVRGRSLELAATERKHNAEAAVAVVAGARAAAFHRGPTIDDVEHAALVLGYDRDGIPAELIEDLAVDRPAPPPVSPAPPVPPVPPVARGHRGQPGAGAAGGRGIVIAVGHRHWTFSLPIRQGQVTAERRRARQSRSHAEPVRGWRIFITNNRSASHDAHRFGTPTWSPRPKQWAGPTPSLGSRRRPTTLLIWQACTSSGENSRTKLQNVGTP